MEKVHQTISRILRVNHAGEFGAIRIYKAQLLIVRLFYKKGELKDFLSHVLQHEVKHCDLFRKAMPSRATRPCHTLWFWSLGGYLLGFLTALMGYNLIMVCTEAVEDTVHHHMNEQIAFLQNRDNGLKNIVEEIKIEELEHLHYAQKRVKHNKFTKYMRRVIASVTEILIWLSTQGDITRMRQDLKKHYLSSYYR